MPLSLPSALAYARATVSPVVQLSPTKSRFFAVNLATGEVLTKTERAKERAIRARSAWLVTTALLMAGHHDPYERGGRLLRCPSDMAENWQVLVRRAMGELA